MDSFFNEDHVWAVFINSLLIGPETEEFDRMIYSHNNNGDEIAISEIMSGPSARSSKTSSDTSCDPEEDSMISDDLQHHVQGPNSVTGSRSSSETYTSPNLTEESDMTISSHNNNGDEIEISEMSSPSARSSEKSDTSSDHEENSMIGDELRHHVQGPISVTGPRSSKSATCTSSDENINSSNLDLHSDQVHTTSSNQVHQQDDSGFNLKPSSPVCRRGIESLSATPIQDSSICQLDQEKRISVAELPDDRADPESRTEPEIMKVGSTTGFMGPHDHLQPRQESSNHPGMILNKSPSRRLDFSQPSRPVDAKKFSINSCFDFKKSPSPVKHLTIAPTGQIRRLRQGIRTGLGSPERRNVIVTMSPPADQCSDLQSDSFQSSVSCSTLSHPKMKSKECDQDDRSDSTRSVAPPSQLQDREEQGVLVLNYGSASSVTNRSSLSSEVQAIEISVYDQLDRSASFQESPDYGSLDDAWTDRIHSHLAACANQVTEILSSENNCIMHDPATVCCDSPSPYRRNHSLNRYRKSQSSDRCPSNRLRGDSPSAYRRSHSNHCSPNRNLESQSSDLCPWGRLLTALATQAELLDCYHRRHPRQLQEAVLVESNADRGTELESRQSPLTCDLSQAIDSADSLHYQQEFVDLFKSNYATSVEFESDSPVWYDPTRVDTKPQSANVVEDAAHDVLSLTCNGSPHDHLVHADSLLGNDAAAATQHCGDNTKYTTVDAARNITVDNNLHGNGQSRQNKTVAQLKAVEGRSLRAACCNTIAGITRSTAATRRRKLRRKNVTKDLQCMVERRSKREFKDSIQTLQSLLPKEDHVVRATQPLDVASTLEKTAVYVDSLHKQVWQLYSNYHTAVPEDVGLGPHLESVPQILNESGLENWKREFVMAIDKEFMKDTTFDTVNPI